jgi:hypothetical protein
MRHQEASSCLQSVLKRSEGIGIFSIVMDINGFVPIEIELLLRVLSFLRAPRRVF